MVNLGTRNNRKKNLTDAERMAILQWLLQHRNKEQPNSLIYGTVSTTAAKFGVSKRTISAIWARGIQSLNSGSIFMDVSSQKKGNSGRKPIDIKAKMALIPSIPLNQRSTMRSLAAAINVFTSAVFKATKSQTILRHSSAIKPFLTPQNEMDRLRFCLSHVRENNLFIDMYNHVHIDEKWFYMTQNDRTYYLAPGEDPPHRTSKSKRYTTKVMFMAAVARPRYDTTAKNWFNGLLGIWPYVYKEPAKKNSKNRVAGTMVTKNIESINTFQHRKMMYEKVIPSIKSKWPLSHRTKSIFIQQDNAKPHSFALDNEISNEISIDGWDIKIKRQPANSPDFNVLDLGFFNSIQSLQHKEAPRTIDELIKVVEDAFFSEKRDTLDNIFLTLQQCMVECLKVHGKNTYKLPHMGKEMLRRQQILPVLIECSQYILEDAQKSLLQQN